MTRARWIIETQSDICEAGLEREALVSASLTLSRFLSASMLGLTLPYR